MDEIERVAVKILFTADFPLAKAGKAHKSLHLLIAKNFANLS